MRSGSRRRSRTTPSRCAAICRRRSRRLTKAILKLTPAQSKSVDTELGTGAVGPTVPASDSLYRGVSAIAQTEGLSVKNLG